MNEHTHEPEPEPPELADEDLEQVNGGGVHVDVHTKTLRTFE